MKPEPQNIVCVLLILFPLFNTFLLPEGLYYTTLLTPLLFVGMIRMRGLRIYGGCLLVSIVCLVCQAGSVEYWRDYLISFLLLQTVVVFVIVFYLYIRLCSDSSIRAVFKYTATVNAALLIPALILLLLPAIRSFVWYEKIISPGIPKLPRLKMFTYEASFYSLSLVPVIVYYGLKKLLCAGRFGILFLSLALSLFLSFSLGVMGALFLAAFLLLLCWPKSLIRRMDLYFVGRIAVIFGVILALLYFFYPANPLFERLRNIVSGADTSARGRTYESFHIAWNVIKMKSVAWGLGPGQFKHLGKDFMDYYYRFSDVPAVARIPNAVAETICIYGLAGLFIRFFLIFFLFIRTKVWTNYYRLFLFLFIFIYQFTGSYLMNPLEYVVWAMAFCPQLFECFDVSRQLKEFQHASTVY